MGLEILLTWGAGFLAANPAVSAILALLVGWAASILTVALAVETSGLTLRTFAVSLRGIVKLTKSTRDDRWLEKLIAGLDVLIYWADAARDVCLPLSRMGYRVAWTVITRIREDLGKPYSKRRDPGTGDLKKKKN